MLFNISSAMRHRDGPLLIPPVRLRDDPAINHGEPVVPPKVDINFHPVAIVPDFFGIQHDRPVGTHPDGIGRHATLLDDLIVTIYQQLAHSVDSRVIFRGEHIAQRGQPGCHDDGIGVVGAGVKDLAVSNLIHHFLAGSKRGQGESATDGFCQADHVGFDVEIFAGATPAHLSSGLHFVEDEQRAMFRAQLAQAFQISRLRHANTDIHRHRLQNESGYLSGILLKQPLCARQIIEDGDQGGAPGAFWNARTCGNLLRRGGAAIFVGLGFHAHHSGIVHTVVAAFHLDDLFAAGEAACQANGVHSGFRAAVGKAHLLYRITFTDLRRQLAFQLMRHAKHGPFVQTFLHRLDHMRIAMPCHQGAET